jgi:2Fe-2S type ferredoxin
VLDAAERAGADLPFLCRTGTCGGCTSRRVEGALAQPSAGLLSPEHEKAGFVLLCSAYPRSDLTILTHQEQNFYDETHLFDKQANKVASR